VRCERTLDVLPRFSDDMLLSEPGTRYRYSNYGWTLVTAAIETAAGERYFRFMRNRIFEPLGMDHTRADSGADAIANRSVDYFPRFAANPYYGTQGPEGWDFSCFSGSAALLSTPSDLVRFVAAIDRGTLLKPATADLLQTSQRVASGEETGYGLGWDLETVDIGGQPTRVIGYDGDVRDGVVMSLLRLPGGIVVVAMSNIAFTDTPAIARKIAEAFMEHALPRARQ
jgi:CubicO group peptidase (beta-lactamase class C family)